jgi:hypothetical protein
MGRGPGFRPRASFFGGGTGVGANALIHRAHAGRRGPRRTQRRPAALAPAGLCSSEEGQRGAWLISHAGQDAEAAGTGTGTLGAADGRSQHGAGVERGLHICPRGLMWRGAVLFGVRAGAGTRPSRAVWPGCSCRLRLRSAHTQSGWLPVKHPEHLADRTVRRLRHRSAGGWILRWREGESHTMARLIGAGGHL